MVAAFALIGLVLGAALGIDADALRTVGAVMLIAFGVVILNPRLNERMSSLMSPLANRSSASIAQVSNDSLFGAFALGGMLGLVWSPCSGPLLASALSLVASKGGALTGTLMLAVFGLGAAIPLVAIAYVSKAGFNRSKGWVLTHIDRIKTVFGVLIIVLGIAILLGYDKLLEAYIVSLMPDSWVDLTTRF
jgi:cytochrome c biogenesis protein CcdA